MSFLDALTDNQRTLLVSLPYRAGLWISQSDRTGGEESDLQELQVLSNIIHGFAEEMFGAENVQHIMSETVRRHEEWSSWAEKGADSVLKDCAQAVDILLEHTDEKDVKAFQNHIIEIGEAVALAFREVEHVKLSDKIRLKLYYILQKLKRSSGRQSFASYHEFSNISRLERQALQELAKALGTQYL